MSDRGYGQVSASRMGGIFLTATLLFGVVVMVGAEVSVLAQFRNINQAQSRIRERMIREQGGGARARVQFNDDGNFTQVDNNNTRVLGSGTYYRTTNDSGRYFTYDAVFNVRSGVLRTLNYQFSGGSGGGNWPGGGGSGQIVYCASDDGRRHYCSAETRGGVRLVNQKSGSPCTQGSTWGFDRNGIWVDRGCRADFEVGYTGGGNFPGGGGNVQNIYCASDDMGRHTCAVDTSGGVRLVRQRSDAACIEGRTWGTTRRGIWVDRGCRADFEVGYTGGGNFPGGGGNYQSIYCASDDMGRHTCTADTSRGVRLVRQRSDVACIEGRTWGTTRNGIWVDRGCRADFEVGYTGGGETFPGGGARPEGNVIYTGPIINRGSRKALDVAERSQREGATIQQWSFADQPNQNWQVIDLGGGEMAIIAQHSGKALTVQGGRDNNGAKIIQRSWNGRPQQRWRFQRLDDNWVAIVSVDNGKCLDVSAQSQADGADIQQWDFANQDNQKWRLARP